jgi:hypothetical protein
VISKSSNLQQRNLLQGIVTTNTKVQDLYVSVIGMQAPLQLAGEIIFHTHRVTEGNGVA